MTDKVQKIREEVARIQNYTQSEVLKQVLDYIDEVQKEPVSEELEEEIKKCYESRIDLMMTRKQFGEIIHRFTEWQKEQDKETIELAEDHAYFAGRTKTIDEIKEALLSEVLPCFMHGGEADEVVAKLDEVLNRKK